MEITFRTLKIIKKCVNSHLVKEVSLGDNNYYV